MYGRTNPKYIGSQISERFLNQNEIKEIVNHSVNHGKFKIYGAILKKFEEVNFKIKKEIII